MQAVGKTQVRVTRSFWLTFFIFSVIDIYLASLAPRFTSKRNFKIVYQEDPSKLDRSGDKKLNALAFFRFVVIIVLLWQLLRPHVRRDPGRSPDLRLDDRHLLVRLLLHGGQRLRRVRLPVEGHEVWGQAWVLDHRGSCSDCQEGFRLRLRMCKNIKVLISIGTFSWGTYIVVMLLYSFRIMSIHSDTI